MPKPATLFTAREHIRRALEDLAPGTSDAEIDEYLEAHPFVDTRPMSSLKGMPKAPAHSLVGASPGELRALACAMMRRLEAVEEPDIRTFRRADQAILNRAYWQLLEQSKSYPESLRRDTSCPDESSVVFPVRHLGLDADELVILLDRIPVLGAKHRNFWQIVAKTARRIAERYQIQLGHATMFVLSSDHWFEPIPPVSWNVGSASDLAGCTQIHLTVNSMASDSEVLAALHEARHHLGLHGKRELASKTYLLALKLAEFMWINEVGFDRVDWRKFLQFWNSECVMIDLPHFVRSMDNRSVYQFTKETKKAWRALSGETQLMRGKQTDRSSVTPTGQTHKSKTSTRRRKFFAGKFPRLNDLPTEMKDD